MLYSMNNSGDTYFWRYCSTLRRLNVISIHDYMELDHRLIFFYCLRHEKY